MVDGEGGIVTLGVSGCRRLEKRWTGELLPSQRHGSGGGVVVSGRDARQFKMQPAKNS